MLDNPRGALSVAPPPAPRVGAIQGQVTELDIRIDKLHQVISSLEDRLNSILGPMGTQGGGTKAPVQTISPVPLASTFEGFVERLNQANTRLYELLTRIEL